MVTYRKLKDPDSTLQMIHLKIVEICQAISNFSSDEKHHLPSVDDLERIQAINTKHIKKSGHTQAFLDAVKARNAVLHPITSYLPDFESQTLWKNLLDGFPGDIQSGHHSEDRAWRPAHIAATIFLAILFTEQDKDFWLAEFKKTLETKLGQSLPTREELLSEIQSDQKSIASLKPEGQEQIALISSSSQSQSLQAYGATSSNSQNQQKPETLSFSTSDKQLRRKIDFSNLYQQVKNELTKLNKQLATAGILLSSSNTDFHFDEVLEKLAVLLQQNWHAEPRQRSIGYYLARQQLKFNCFSFAPFHSIKDSQGRPCSTLFRQIEELYNGVRTVKDRLSSQPHPVRTHHP